MSKPDPSKTSTSAPQPATSYTKADSWNGVPRATTSTGTSVLHDKQTVVVRALRGPSVTIPFDVDREAARRLNREANRGGGGGRSTGNSD
jgi:hypothetical protein